MACYVSAGHHLKDPGAVANGLQENKLTIRVRDRVVSILKGWGLRVITDNDSETLAQYLARIQPGEGSVVVEFHFDAAAKTTATGSSAFYADNASENSKSFAHDLAIDSSSALGIANRGALSESQSHRGRLGLVHEPGITALLEVGFISNPEDMAKFDTNFEKLCQKIAETIRYYEQLIP